MERRDNKKKQDGDGKSVGIGMLSVCIWWKGGYAFMEERQESCRDFVKRKL